MVDVMPIPEVARELDVSERRVLALIHAGQLPASRIGRPWIVERRAVDEFLRMRRRHGRRLSQANAWALLVLLADEEPRWLRRDAVSRLRRYARDPEWLLAVLRHSEPRSEKLSLWLPREDVSRLARYRLVRSALSAEGALPQLDIIPRQDEPLDVYASPVVAHEIEKRLSPERSSDSPNLIIRIPARSWVLQHGPEAPLSVVAADLLDHQDARVRRAGEDALYRLTLAR